MWQWNEFTMWLVFLIPVTMALVMGFSAQFKSLPAWFHKIASVIRSTFKALGLTAFFAFVLFVLLPTLLKEGLIWLFPNSKTGYAMKYGTREDHVYIEAKPHDCEWGKAPIGNKYCHFEKVVETGKASNGTPEVYVSWRKVEE